jgi:hypothetical protein
MAGGRGTLSQPLTELILSTRSVPTMPAIASALPVAAFGTGIGIVGLIVLILLIVLLVRVL